MATIEQVPRTHKQRVRTTGLVAGATALGLGAALLSAVGMTSAQGMAGVAATPIATVADTSVTAAQAKTNFGTAAGLNVSNSPQTRSYLRFRVPTVATGTTATLRIYANTSSSAGVAVSTVTPSSWTEYGMTYSSSPLPGALVTTTGVVSAGAWLQADVTSAVKAAGTVDFVLASAGTTGASFAARESGTAPQLVLQTGTATPSSTPSASPTASPSASATVPPATGVVRAAFYYPWFPEAWNQHSITPYTNYSPSRGLYNSSDPALITSHIDDMLYGGLNAGIASW
jgi:hypothetical protein